MLVPTPAMLALALALSAAASHAAHNNAGANMNNFDGVPVGTRLIQPGVAIALGVVVAAAVVAQIVMRVRWAVAEASADKKVAAVESVLQRDEALERRMAASAQLFPVGARVSTKAHGVGTVLAFDSDSQTYSVETGGDKPVVELRDADFALPEVAELVVYPIKSCAGIRLDSVAVTAKGIAHDRSSMFTDENCKFNTQRRYHKMALITPRLEPDMENPTAIVLSAPGMPSLTVPIVHEGKGPERSVTVWRSAMRAIDQGDAAAAWAETFLADALQGRKLRFVRVKDSFERAVDPKYAPGHATGFADGFPFLLALEESLAELNEALEHAIPINRFRANIVLKNAPAFADEHWNVVDIGGLRFRNVKPCSRCNLPCVDQATGESDPAREPTKTLARLRNGELLGFRDGKKHENYFGSNLVVESAGELRVGARARVLTLKREVVA